MADHYKDASRVINRCEHLKRLWTNRDTKIVDNYRLLSLADELKQKGMESVVTNDPRTFYNMALHLLTPRIPHKIPVQGLERQSIVWANNLERIIDGTWKVINKEYRRRGRKSWLEYTTGLLLSTGWYAVLAMAASDKLVAETWNPIEVYPDWDSQGLQVVAHIFTLDPQAAERLFIQRNWPWDQTLRARKVTIYDLWEDFNGQIINVTVANHMVVKPETLEPFDEIPVLVGPVGGLPDDGPISVHSRSRVNTDWRSEVGQSILSTNADVYRQYNRMVTFMQQILRDTAQPKYWEKSSGDNILTPEGLESRGAIFRLGSNDEVGTMQMPGIPVELTGLISTFDAMIQRGSFPHAISGQVQNIPLGLMSQVAAAATQVLSLYKIALTDLLTDIDNIWLEGVLNRKFVVDGVELPESVPAGLMDFDIDYPINIPGDLVQRATITRMISPSARIAPETALDLFFPEIFDPAAEMAKARASDSQQHPVFITLNLISALREEANILRTSGNNDDADLLEQASVALTQQILGAQGQPPQNGDTPPAAGIPSAGLSPQVQTLMSQLGISTSGEEAPVQ